MSHDEHDENPEETIPGLVAVGGQLVPETLLSAYQNGIFPWPTSDADPLLWFSPDPRAILEFAEVRPGRTLEKAQRKALDSGWLYTLDQAFDQVIERCAKVPRPAQPGEEADEASDESGDPDAPTRTWITPKMIAAYREMHRLGHAHSFEAWDGDGRLVGGLYGIAVEGVFSGESMFHDEPNASKLTLLYAIGRLAGWGAQWIDIQQLTPHMEALGAREIPRDDYLVLLRETQTRGLRLFPSER